MGTEYKKVFFRLRVRDLNAGFIPHTDPPVHYAVYWKPDDALNKTYPYADVLDPVRQWVDGPTGPYSGDSPFQKLHGLLKLPKVVIVINSCAPDFHYAAGHGTIPDPPPTFPDTAHNHYLGLGEYLYDTLQPFGIMVYQCSSDVGIPGNENEWILRSMPWFGGNTDEPFIGGDVYFIALLNNSRFKSQIFQGDMYVETHPGGVDTITFVETFSLLPNNNVDDITVPNSPGHTLPIDLAARDYWSQLAAKFRNFHGLVCCCPWDGDSTTLTGNSNFLASQLGLPGGSDKLYRNTQRLDLEDTELLESVARDVDWLNEVAPDIPGDASWEQATIANNTDYAFFLDKVRTWFGV